MLLQVLDDGRLTDGQGRTVDFRNTVLIMTSNIRSAESMREHFRPEFLNRIDEIVEFKALSREQLGEIVELQLERLRDRLAERGLALELTDAAKEAIAEAGWDPAYGARPLKRAIQRLRREPARAAAARRRLRRRRHDPRRRAERRPRVHARRRLDRPPLSRRYAARVTVQGVHPRHRRHGVRSSARSTVRRFGPSVSGLDPVEAALATQPRADL